MLLPIDAWESATQQFRDELEDWGRSLDEAFEFEQFGVIFGEPAFSGNHFVLFDKEADTLFVPAAHSLMHMSS